MPGQRIETSPDLEKVDSPYPRPPVCPKCGSAHIHEVNGDTTPIVLTKGQMTLLVVGLTVALASFAVTLLNSKLGARVLVEGLFILGVDVAWTFVAALSKQKTDAKAILRRCSKCHHFWRDDLLIEKMSVGPGEIESSAKQQ